MALVTVLVVVDRMKMAVVCPSVDTWKSCKETG